MHTELCITVKSLYALYHSLSLSLSLILSFISQKKENSRPSASKSSLGAKNLGDVVVLVTPSTRPGKFLATQIF